MQKNNYRLIIMLLALFLTLTACSTNKEPGVTQSTNGNDVSPTNDSVTLRIMWWGSDARHTATLEVIELFKKKYPHITFSEEYLGADGYWDKLNILIAGGNKPDIFQLGNNYPDYVSKNALLDLTPYVNNEITTNNTDESIVASGMIDDQLYGVNLGSNALGIIYNKPLIEQAGLPLPQENWTWDEFSDYLQQLKTALPELTPMGDASGNQHFFNHFIRQHDRAIYENGEITFTKEDAINWFEYWENLREAGLISDAQMSATYLESGPDKSAIVEGKAVMTVAFSNQLKAYQSLMQDELEMTLLPFGNDVSGIWLQPSQFMAVSKDTKHPKEAAMFLDFMVNDPEATLILGTERGVPGSSAVREALKDGADAVDVKVFNFIDKAIANSRDMDRELPNGSEWASVLMNSVQKIAFKTTTIEAAAEDVVDAAHQALTK